MALLLGIDFGTSYFKVGLFEPTGALRGLGRVAVGKDSPAPGRSEVPVERFWHLLRTGLAEALVQAGADIRAIAGVSYSSQANTFLLLDRTDAPLTPLIVWDDQRAHPLDPAVAAWGGAEAFRRTAGFSGLAAEFAAAKWWWFQRQEPATWARVARVMTLSDYFTFALTGETAGDASTAALTGVHATATGGWWPEAMEFFDVSPAALSRPLTPGTRCGQTVARARELLGLPAGVPFAVGGLDHYMAAIGSGIDRLGDASISTGTVLAALQLVDRVEPMADCFHGLHFDGRFYRLAFDQAGATQLEDYQRQFAPGLSIAELTDLTATVRPGATLEPGMVGNRRHAVMVRSLMERISATHRTLLQRLHAPRSAARVIATGGGARSSEWLQINANMIGTIIIAPRCHERACLGAAAFAGVAAGLFSRVSDALLAMVHSDRVIEPDPATMNIYRRKWNVS